MTDLSERKRDLHERLTMHHVDPGFMPSEEQYGEKSYSFISPQDAAKRMCILLAISLSAFNFDEAERVMEWLKKEGIWNAVSENEKIFFRDPSPSEQQKQELSWRFESAYLLAWALQKVSELPEPSGELKEKEVKDFLTNVPGPGSSITSLLKTVQFREAVIIIDEKLFYQSAMLRLNYQRDNHLENSISIQPLAALERYSALLFILGGNNNSWDELTAIEEEEI